MTLGTAVSYLLLGDVVLLMQLCLSFPGLDKDAVSRDWIWFSQACLSKAID